MCGPNHIFLVVYNGKHDSTSGWCLNTYILHVFFTLTACKNGICAGFLYNYLEYLRTISQSGRISLNYLHRGSEACTVFRASLA